MQSKNRLLTYRHSFHAIMDITKKEGITTIFKGLELTLWRNSLWHAVYFGVLGKQKEASDRFSKSKLNDFIFGCVGGGLGSFFSSPFDVVKSRVQNSASNELYEIPWACKAVFKLWEREGFLSLYRGFIPKVTRLALGGGILMFSFEWMLAGVETIHLMTIGRVGVSHTV